MINKTAINAILFIHDDLSMASMEGNDENLLKMGCRDAGGEIPKWRRPIVLNKGCVSRLSG